MLIFWQLFAVTQLEKVGFAGRTAFGPARIWCQRNSQRNPECESLPLIGASFRIENDELGEQLVASLPDDDWKDSITL